MLTILLGTVIPAFAGGQTRITKAFGKFGVQMKERMLQERQNLRPLALDTLQVHFFIMEWLGVG